MIVKTEKQRQQNRREIDRLMLKVMTPGATGRNAGATRAALDRRLAADLGFYRSAA